MKTSAFLGAIGLAALALSAAPAQAQDRYYETWRGQRDVPGDFRCDAFWDASRTDCDAAWRDQRSTTQRRADGGGRRFGDGYGRHHDRFRHGWRAGGYGHGSATTAYYGAWGRPDLVTGSGPGGYGHARDPQRIEWCRWNYRSYDASTGYYRAYSGRMVYCG